MIQVDLPQRGIAEGNQRWLWAVKTYGVPSKTPNKQDLWDFYVDSETGHVVFFFEKEADAVLFKLKFG